MAVTPMDLQVLFMQESRVANKAQKTKDFPKEMRGRRAKRFVARSMMDFVEDIDETDTRKVDGEGGGSGQFLAGQRRQQENPEDEESNRQQKGGQEDGKGDVVDMQA